MLSELNRRLDNLLSEQKQTGTLYHFTNIDAAYLIVKENRLKGTKSRIELKDNNFYISFTRNKNFNRVNRSGVTTDCYFTIDGTKLSDRYKIKPYHDELTFKKYAVKKFSPIDYEQEEILSAKEISPVNRYVIGFNCMYDNFISSDYIEDLIDSMNLPKTDKDFKSEDDYDKYLYDNFMKHMNNR